MKRMLPSDLHTAKARRALRISLLASAILAGLLQAPRGWAQQSVHSKPVFGPAPTAPHDLSALPGNGPRKLDGPSAGFNVNTYSRAQVRQFYNAVYSASEGIPINSSDNTTNCSPGTNSTAFLNAELWRINWFRTMSGIPAAVTFSAPENVEAQSAALMMSANNQLLHTGIPASWSCYSAAGADAADNSNLSLGINGPDAISGYIQDPGANNAGIPHRRWLLYPQTQVMAGGDVPAQAGFAAANATWIFDSNYGGRRPATTEPYVAWPPPGYAPYPVVYPQWSFALSNADLSAATVTMLSNGVPLSVILQPYDTDYGESTVVWYPSALDPTSYDTLFPFNGADTVYAITVNNAHTTAGTRSFSYNVTVFDPALSGPDDAPTLVSGTNRPSVNENNPYSCNPSANPNTTGYQWLAAQSTNGDLSDHALNGLTNFTISPSPIYPVITSPPVGSGQCFHLNHTNPVPQLLQFTEVFFPAANTTLSFQSLLGYASTTEIARVQISTNDGVWLDIYTQPGNNGDSETSFASHTLSLSNCAGRITRLRFDFDFTGGSYFPSAASTVGWCLENITIANASQLIGFTTNATISTNFNFVPAAPGGGILEARGVLFDQFALDWSPATPLTALTNPAPTLIVLAPPAIAGSQAQIPFALTQGAAASLNLLQAGQLAGPWTTNAAAVLTSLGGISYQFTAPLPGVTAFFRVLAR